MSKVIYWIIAPPLAAVIILFSLNNRVEVVLDLWPLEILTLPIPLFSIALVSMVVGFLIGSLIAWGPLLALRRQVFAETKRADKAERDILKTKKVFKDLQNNTKEENSQIAEFQNNDG